MFWLLMVMGFVQAQNPIIRVMQIDTYDTPDFWWRDNVTHNLQTYLADDVNNPALYNK